MKVQTSEHPVSSTADGAADVRDAGWLELPTDFARATHGAAPSASGTVRFGLAPAEVEAIEALARSRGCGVRSVCAAAWGVVLSRLGGLDHFLVDVREDAPASGGAASVRAVRVDLRGAPSAGDLPGRFDAALRDAATATVTTTAIGIDAATALPAGLEFGAAPTSAPVGDLVLCLDIGAGRIDAALRFSTGLFTVGAMMR